MSRLLSVSLIVSVVGVASWGMLRDDRLLWPEVFFVFVCTVAMQVLCLGRSECLRALVTTREFWRHGINEPQETLETLLMLTEYSRRNGLLGLADVQSNWEPMRRVCRLVASAANRERIRAEQAVEIEKVSRRYTGVIRFWWSLALTAVVSALLVSALISWPTATSAESTTFELCAMALAVGLAVAMLLAMPMAQRLTLAREREITSVLVAYEGAVQLLQDNSVEAVFDELVSLIPGGSSIRWQDLADG